MRRPERHNHAQSSPFFLLPVSIVVILLAGRLLGPARGDTAPGGPGSGTDPSPIVRGLKPDIPDLSHAPEGILEVTGTVRRERARHWLRRLNRDTVLVLVTDRESFFLIRGIDKRVVAAIEPLVGREITVRGSVIPANARHPRRAIKVLSFVEGRPMPAVASLPPTLPQAGTPGDSR